MSTQQNPLVVVNNPPASQAMTFGFDPRIFTIRPATLEIVQNNSRSVAKGAKPGHFFDGKMGQNLTEIEVVMAALPQQNRVLLPPGQLGGKPICKSRDGMVPVTNDDRLTPQAAKCGYINEKGKFIAVCDNAKWDRYWKKKNSGQIPQKEDKPPCRDQKEFMFVERKSLLPFRMQIHGASAKPFNDAMEGVGRNALVLQAQGKNPEPYWFTMKLGLTQVSGSQGIYYVLNVTNIAVIPAEELEKFKKQFEAMMALRQSVGGAMDESDEREGAVEGEIVEDGPPASA